MITTTAAAMKMKFPEFAGLSDAKVSFAIEEAQLAIGDGSTWVLAEAAQLAMMYYAGHVLAVGLMTAESGTGQIVQSESITGVGSTTFAAVPANVCDLDKTSYGQRYESILAQNFTGGFVV